jgi:hypothetical protein
MGGPSDDEGRLARKAARARPTTAAASEAFSAASPSPSKNQAESGHKQQHENEIAKGGLVKASVEPQPKPRSQEQHRQAKNEQSKRVDRERSVEA